MNRLIPIFCLLLSAPQDVQSLAKKAAPRKAKAKVGAGGFGAGAAAPTFQHVPDTSQKTTRMLDFLKAQNSKGLDNIDVGSDPETGIRGLFCTKSFKKGQILCRIPSDCALALSDPSKNGEDAPTLAHGGANFLKMYMKDERARKLWSPYLDTLPTKESNFDPTPDFFDDEALQLLEFPRIINKAKERKEQIQTVANEMGLDVDELQFATWLAASRSFSISLSTQTTDDGAQEIEIDDRGQILTKAGDTKDVKVLVPFIDFCNHSSDQANCKLTLIDPEKDEAWFALEATRPIAAGKELTISYGNGVESSVNMLLNYGFVPRPNKFDEFMLKKGGDDCISSPDGWTTSLEEDQSMKAMAGDDRTLSTILDFRIKLKESYP
jgi:hypothetical protein